MVQIHCLSLVAKARRHHKQMRAKDPSLPALVPGAGKILPGGALRVALPTVGGGTFVYSAVAVPTWRFHPGAPLARSKAHGNGNGDGAPAAEVSPAERVRRALDEALTVLAAIERRAAHFGSEFKIAAE
jgi:hypothetical protein